VHLAMVQAQDRHRAVVLDSGHASAPDDVIGSQGRGANEGPVPHPPFNPCMRFSRTRLSDGLLDMVTQLSGSGWCP
jgi:hypothetical protein